MSRVTQSAVSVSLTLESNLTVDLLLIVIVIIGALHGLLMYCSEEPCGDAVTIFTIF